VRVHPGHDSRLGRRTQTLAPPDLVPGQLVQHRLARRLGQRRVRLLAPLRQHVAQERPHRLATNLHPQAVEQLPHRGRELLGQQLAHLRRVKLPLPLLPNGAILPLTLGRGQRRPNLPQPLLQAVGLVGRVPVRPHMRRRVGRRHRRLILRRQVQEPLGDRPLDLRKLLQPLDLVAIGSQGSDAGSLVLLPRQPRPHRPRRQVEFVSRRLRPLYLREPNGLGLDVRVDLAATAHDGRSSGNVGPWTRSARFNTSRAVAASTPSLRAIASHAA
jgi:hypothetical protein